MVTASSNSVFLLFFLVISLLQSFSAHGQLNLNFYGRTCPGLANIVLSTMTRTLQRDPRMGASILRLFFHDCFVNGCDASVLLDDTLSFAGEKNSARNRNSLRGFEVIDAIKATMEAACNATVSCADILALAARDGVVLLGGPTWQVLLGRRDALTTSRAAADANLPPAFANLANLLGLFARKGLNARDLTALSGAHTIGQARCVNFRSHIYNDQNIDPGFAALRRQTCPAFGGDNNLAPLDAQRANLPFDNGYFRNLVALRGLLHSDQELFNGGSVGRKKISRQNFFPVDGLVRLYSSSTADFFRDFAAAMVKMGNINPLTGRLGQIRLNCRRIN